MDGRALKRHDITFLGANSLFGRVASALLSRTPSVRKLKLYDDVESPLHESNSEPTCVVQWHRGKEELTVALEGSDIVVIGDESKVISINEQDALISTASKVVDFVYAVAKTTPKAMVVVAATPLNLMVPLAGYVLKELDCYDGRKLLGVTSVDTLRANAIYSEYIDQPNSILPVVGGASPQTRVPIFSHARPSLDLPEEDLHLLIEKIKSFDLNMEGPALKASTLERAYATVRLVNSLLSGLQEEPSTKEMALAKTSLIPEVNYFSLPVDLGKFGIERTFGLPQLSPLETEMIDYAIINLNNDLMKAQDLYASFKPCFEMLKSIVGGSSKCNNLTNEDATILRDPIIDTRKKKDHKMKTNKRNRSETHIRNRKRARANKLPILHCPAPEVVTDMPIEEKFGKIERVHKKLQVNQILHEMNVDGLPRLKCKEVNDLSQEQIRTEDTDDILTKVLIKENPCTETINRSIKNINSDLVLLNNSEATNAQQPVSDSEIPNTIDLIGTKNDFKDDALKQHIVCKNNLENMENLKSDAEITKNVKVTIDLMCKIKNNICYDHLQSNAQSQSSRIETMKSLMLQKQNQYQKTKTLYRNNSSTSKIKNEYLKNRRIEPKMSNSATSSNSPILTDFRSLEEREKIEGELNNEEILKKQTNENSNMGELQGLEKIETNNMPMIENDAVDEQFSLLMKTIEEQNGTGIPEEKIETGIRNQDFQEMRIPKDKVFTAKENQECGRIILEKKFDALKAEGKTNEIEYGVGEKTRTFFENNLLVQGPENIHESFSLKKESKSLKKGEKCSLKTSICDDVDSHSQLASADNNDNISNANNKANELIKNEIIQAEKVITVGENKMIKNENDCIASNVSSEKCFERETEENNHVDLQIKSEAEKHRIKSITASVYDSTKDNIDGEVSKQTDERADSIKSEKEMTKPKFTFISGQMLDDGKSVIEIDAQEKLKELECLLKKEKRDDEVKPKEKKISAANTSKVSYDPLEAVNKIIEITTQKLKNPLKFLNASKPEMISETERVEGTEKDKEKKKVMEIEETKKLKEIKACHAEGKSSKSIEVFNYEPKNMHDTKNVTNINEMIQSLVQPNKPEANSVDKSLNDFNDIHVVDSKSIKLKVMNLKNKAAKLNMEHKKQSKGENLRKGDQRAHASINLDLEKPTKETPFPFLNNATKMPKDETFDKCKWLKHKIRPDTKGNSPDKINLKTIDEGKALTIHTRNINESFTKRIQKVKSSNKITDGEKSVSYTIHTKNKKDNLSKRYTVLKKGQLCNMVKDDINADELKAKLYQNSLVRGNTNSSVKRDDKKIIDMKDLSKIELLKPPPNKERSTYKPSSKVLETPKKALCNTEKDTNDIKNVKKSNNNAISLKNKSFLNMMINRVSKRSPTLNETTETLGVRGSHYRSGTYSKKPINSDEQKIQQMTKKAKEQLNITRFKNNKRISSGPSGDLPVVSNEFGEKRQPVTSKEQDKTKSTKDVNDSMTRSKNKILLMKEKYQRLKNTNSPPKNHYVAIPPSAAKIISNKDKKQTKNGIRNTFIENMKSSPKSNPEPKLEKNVTKKDETELKQDELSPIEESGKENNTKASEKIKSAPQDLVLDERGESLNEANSDKKQGTNSYEVCNKKQSTETEEKSSEISQNTVNLTTSGDNNITTVTNKVPSNNITTVTNKVSSQENQETNQSLKDQNIPIKESFEKQQELAKKIEEESNITTINKTKSLKDETTSSVETINKSPNTFYQQVNPKKKLLNDKSQGIENSKLKEKKKSSIDISQSKRSINTASNEKSQKPKINLPENKALLRIKSAKKKAKSVDEQVQRSALKAVFSSRPTAGELMKMKQEQKTSAAESKTNKVPSHNLGVRDVVKHKLIPRHTTASSLLLDPDIEKRPATNRKEIHPSLMHAVKPFHSQNTDSTKFKTNFYSRWTPQNLKLKENKEGETNVSKDEQIQKNPFVSGKINLTSDLFKAYMRKNRNHEFTNSNGDVQFLHQSGQLASIPQPGVSANSSRINDQRVAFSTLEANSEKKIIPKKETPNTLTVVNSSRFQSQRNAPTNEKTGKLQSSLFNKPMKINKILNDSPSNDPPVKGKNIFYNSYKSQPLAAAKNNPVSNKINYATSPFRYKEKEVEWKRMHLLKAFQNQENNELKFEELQRNYKEQLNKTPANTMKKALNKEVSKETPNRLKMLKRHSVETIKNVASEDSRHNKKPFSAPAEYHPSFPLSKPKKFEKNNKKDESGNTLKKRWTQLLDIFQSVITTEKKNWDQDNPDKSLLAAGGSHLTDKAVVPKSKIILREALDNSNSTAKKIQSYYRRHSAGGPKFQSSYSLSSRTNKM